MFQLTMKLFVLKAVRETQITLDDESISKKFHKKKSLSSSLSLFSGIGSIYLNNAQFNLQIYPTTQSLTFSTPIYFTATTITFLSGSNYYFQILFHLITHK